MEEATLGDLFPRKNSQTDGHKGGKKVCTQNGGYILAEMRFMQRAYPNGECWLTSSNDHHRFHSNRKIWSILSAVTDPEIPVLSITDLGIVRAVNVP